MGKGYVVKLAGDELVALIELTVHELQRRGSDDPTRWETILQRTLAKLGQLHPDGLALSLNPPGLPARITREIFKVIANPAALQMAAKEVQSLEHTIENMAKELKRATKTKRQEPIKPVPAAAPDARDANQPVGISRGTTWVKLTPSAGRQRGGLLRAAQVAEAKGDTEKAAQLRKRADDMLAAVTAAASGVRTTPGIS